MAMAMADPEIELAPISISISTPPAPPHDALPSTSTATTLEADDSCGFDVFINHRGPDVKNTFASHLYRRLLQRGLRVFLDKPELQQGLNLTLQIQRAIRTASVHVAVFSPRYAESKWCLDELLQMLESEAIVIPVFYHVKPAQLRWTDRVSSQDLTDGVYSQDLRKLAAKTTYDTRTHQNKPRHDPETIQKWREALSRVAEISGFELDANNTDEGELLDKIVERVVKNVKKRNLDETAKDSENTALLEQQQHKLGKLEVLSLWSEKLQALCRPILELFGFILGVAFVILWARMMFTMFKSFSEFSEDFSKDPNNPFKFGFWTNPDNPHKDSSNFNFAKNIPKVVWESSSASAQPPYFLDMVWVTNSAYAHPIWWQCHLFFVLFMNMVVFYIM